MCHRSTCKLDDGVAVAVAVQVDVLDNVKVYLNGPDRASSSFHVFDLHVFSGAYVIAAGSGRAKICATGAERANIFVARGACS